MRISELSKRSGVSLATIKYYIREGLLPAGERTGPNQANYGPGHLQRLTLIRGLIEVAGVSIADVARLTEVLDSDPDPGEAFAVAQQIVSATPSPEATAHNTQRARDALGADAFDDDPGHAELSAAHALDVFAAVGIEVSDDWLHTMAEAARSVARQDLDELQARPNLAEQTRIAALGTALGDVVLTSFRRACQAAESKRRLTSATDERIDDTHEGKLS